MKCDVQDPADHKGLRRGWFLFARTRDTELFRRRFGQTSVLKQPRCALLPFGQERVGFFARDTHQSEAAAFHQFDEISVLRTFRISCGQFCNNIIRCAFGDEDAKERPPFNFFLQNFHFFK